MRQLAQASQRLAGGCGPFSPPAAYFPRLSLICSDTVPQIGSEHTAWLHLKLLLLDQASLSSVGLSNLPQTPAQDTQMSPFAPKNRQLSLAAVSGGFFLYSSVFSCVTFTISNFQGWPGHMQCTE